MVPVNSAVIPASGMSGRAAEPATFPCTLMAAHHDLTDLATLDLNLVCLLTEAEVAPLGRHRPQAMRAVGLAGVVARRLQATECEHR